MRKNISKPTPLGVPRAHHITTILIKRGNGKNHDVILEDGEMVFNKTDKEFYVGDGETPIRNLKSYSGLVEGDNGIVYLVRVDENGKPEAKEAKMIYSNRKYIFKTKED